MEEAFFKEGNDVGVLVIHGFTGSPGSMRDLAQSMPIKVSLSLCQDLLVTVQLQKTLKSVNIKNG